MNFIPYGKQSVDPADIESVVNVLKTANLTQGPAIDDFEKAIAKFVHADYCVAVNSGTAALHISCLSMGLEPGFEFITTPNTFVATANCAIYCGGTPKFVDIDSRTYNLDPDLLVDAINEKTRIVIPVHFAGQPVDLKRIHEIVTDAEQRFGHKIYLLEDASHALGSKYRDTMIGACAFSDAAVFSFHPVKHVTTGEGGLVATNSYDLYQKLVLYRSHGITREPYLLERPSPGQWSYQQVALGYNYRITDIQSALGLSQLKRLPDFIKRRKEIIVKYKKAFNGAKNIRLPFEHEECESNFHLFVLQLDFEAIGMSRSKFIYKLQENGIGSQVHYVPVHTQPYYMNNYGFKLGDFPKSEAYFQHALSIPLFHSMKDEEVKYVINKILELTGN